ncbi:MAG: MBL fold metallo-hydrolase [Chloroflexi bacterium]|nr:MBL fold metallo-hydrolase [Chloroflexota bacterium]MDA1270397.1 MBL fold metallo-hydrolase [Chloroflexota bacterium]PKB58770.1 MAG: MBL fold metallo-hydrolase [SAR202 cluster bacterium Casp-Chloro-G2]
MTSPHAHSAGQLPEPTLEEVSEGIYAYVQLDGSWGLNNTGFIQGSDALTMIDTCFTEARTRAYLAAVETVSKLPAKTLVNTHHHGDHTHGNYLVPGAAIVGHELCRQTVIATGLQALHPLFPGVEWGNLELAPPFVTFKDRLELYSDDLKIELIFMGPAHTTNDIVAWIPDRKLLFSGDLIFNQGTPFVAMGSVSGSLEAVKRLRELGAETIVPGHGTVCGPAVMDDIEAYLTFVQSTAKSAFESGTSPLDAARETDLGRFGEWTDTERLAGNLHRAFSELRGEPLGTVLDLGPIAADMVALNGGQPVRCLA